MNYFWIILSTLLAFLHLAPLAPFQFSTRSKRTSITCKSSIINSPSTTGDKIVVYNELLSWIIQRGGILSKSIEVRVRSAAEGGAGIFATTNIKKEETLITLPPKHYDVEALMSVLPDQPQTQAKSVLKKLADGGNDEKTVALIGALAFAFLSQCHCDAVNTSIGPYLNVLSKTNMENHVVHWSQDEVDALLMNTIAWTKVGDTRQALQKMNIILSPSFTSGISSHCYTQEEVFSQLCKSFALADSRVFSHPCQGYQLHPVIDLINHSHQNNVKWYMPDDARVRLMAVRDIEQGEEIFASYGLKPSWDWGADYGFCPDSSSFVDYVAIPLFPLSLYLSEDMEDEILERLYSSLPKGVAILPLTVQRSDSKTRVMRPCILWKMSSPLSELLSIYNPVARVMEDLEKENDIISHDNKFLLNSVDESDSDRGCVMALDSLLSRLEFLNEGSLISNKWIQSHHEKVSDGRMFLANRLREAEWDACIDMKTKLELHLRKTGLNAD